MTAALAVTSEPLQRERSFFGHPPGLAYLAFTEAWERFSYYSMTALLVLYMVDQLLRIGTFYEEMTPLASWLFHAGIAACGGFLVLLFGPLLRRVLEPGEARQLRPAALTEELER